MKVLTPEQMRDVDRRTIQLGIPSLVLMENAGSRVVDVLRERYDPLSAQRIVVVCGKGNNGGDGLVIARQLHTRFRPRGLEVVLAYPPEELKGDARTNFEMLLACGCPYTREVTAGMSTASLVIDALLGTGLKGPAEGRALDLIRMMNSAFPMATRVSVDVPSGLHPKGEAVAAAVTVTFTAPKIDLVMPPTCDLVGELIVAPIGTPREIVDGNAEINLHLSEAQVFAPLFLPRPRGAHKGDFGHVLVIGGAHGKGGAAAMAGLSALRAGAGLVTVATDESERPAVTTLAPELMTQRLDDSSDGKDVLAIGPGLGRHTDAALLARSLFLRAPQPMVVDADALNALAGTEFRGPGPLRVLTPHPGEMGRLTGLAVTEVQASRLSVARTLAFHRQVVVVLKGQRTLIAFPNGEAWINPTGTPAMATGGSGDILTGLLAGMLAQFPDSPRHAILAAVWLHGRAGELGANTLTEQSLIATDILRNLPDAIREIQSL